MKFNFKDDLINSISDKIKNEFNDVNVFSPDCTITEFNNSFLLGQTADAKQVVDLLIEKKLNHILQYNKNFFEEDLQITLGLLKNPKSYFNDPLASLTTNQLKQMVLEFSGAKDKPLLKEKLVEFLGPDVSQNVQESAEAIFEELYMNAVIDAPKEALKNFNLPSPYESTKKAKLFYVLSNKYLLMICEDPCGSLLVDKFTSRMKEVYKTGAGEAINFREGGAGLGCVIMFEHCSHLFIGVQPQNKTIVSCFVPLGMSYRQRANVKKSIHIIKE